MVIEKIKSIGKDIAECVTKSSMRQTRSSWPRNFRKSMMTEQTELPPKLTITSSTTSKRTKINNYSHWPSNEKPQPKVPHNKAPTYS
jgi:hypothetical protein